MSETLSEVRVSLDCSNVLEFSTLEQLCNILKRESRNTLVTDSLLSAIERAAFLQFEAGSYGLVPAALERVDHIKTLLIFAQRQVQISKGWFGGGSYVSTIRSPLIARLMLSATLGQEYDGMATEWTTTGVTESELVRQTLAHDEITLAVGIAIKRLQNRITDFPLDFVTYSLEVLHNIGFSYEVVIDWLESEAVSTSFLWLFLKSLNPEFVEYMRKYTPPHRMSEDCWVASGLSSEDVTITVKELAGNRLETQTYSFSYQEQTPMRVESPATDDKTDGVIGNLRSFLARLGPRLRALQTVCVVDHTRLIPLVERAESILELFP